MKENLTPGKQIERLCRKQGISQKMLAERIGVSPSQISRIIRERNEECQQRNVNGTGRSISGVNR